MKNKKLLGLLTATALVTSIPIIILGVNNSNLKNENKNLISDKNNLLNEIERQRSIISSLKHKIDGFLENQKIFEKKITDLETEKKYLETQIGILEVRLKKYNKTIQNLILNLKVEQNKLHANKTLIENLKQQIKTIKHEIGNLENYKESSSKQLKVMSEKIEYYEKNAKEWEDAYREKSRDLKIILSKLEETTIENGDLREKINELQSKVDELLKQNQTSQLELKKIKEGMIESTKSEKLFLIYLDKNLNYWRGKVKVSIALKNGMEFRNYENKNLIPIDLKLFYKVNSHKVNHDLVSVSISKI